MSASDEYQAFFEPSTSASVESTKREMPLVIEVPSGLPVVHRQGRSGLSHSRYAVGVDANHYTEEPTGKVWQAWFVLGVASAILSVGAAVMLLAGEWIVVLAASPLVGLWLMGMVRSLRAEQRAKRAKRMRQRRRLYDR